MAERVVISQPMFLPWVGLFDQIRYADIYVHLTDVDFPRGRSFMNRVQVELLDGTHWLTVPLKRESVKIDEVEINEATNWRKQHLGTLKRAFARAPFKDDAFELIEKIYDYRTTSLSQWNQFGIELITDYFNFKTKFKSSRDFLSERNGSERILDIVQQVGGTVYLTGHGAKNYLKHEAFETAGIQVQYMDYSLQEYPQLSAEFTPYVTVLDLIANCGKAGVNKFDSKVVDWKEFCCVG